LTASTNKEVIHNTIRLVSRTIQYTHWRI